MTAPKEIIQESWDTEFGSINVGDKVVAVAEGYSHNVSVYAATYLGYIIGPTDWNGNVQRFVKLDHETRCSLYFYAGTNDVWKYDYREAGALLRSGKIELREVPYTRRTTLQLNRIAPLRVDEQQVVSTINKLL